LIHFFKRKSVTETVDVIESAEVTSEVMPEDLKAVNPQMAEEEQKAEEEEATSLDANKENVSSNSDSEEAEKSETVEKSLSPPPVPQGGRMKSPFTNLNDKIRGAGVSHKLKQSGSNSRGAMLLSLATSRKASMDLASAPAIPSPSPLLSPSPKVESAKRPWMKYAPSPSHASPTASCLKRTVDDLDSSIEGSPVSAKRARLSEMGSRRVHFNENPVSDSVEIPRVPDGKHTRKKLQLTGYDQDLFIGRAGGQTAQNNQDKAPEIKLEVGPQTIFPDLASCQEPITSISHQLATGPWGKVLEADLKSHNITKICQLASMDCGQVRLLRGIKPPKEVTVRNALKGLHSRLKKETVQPEATVRVRAPVVEAAATQEEEEEIKAALFARPSPTPTEDGDDHPTSSSQVMPGESPHMSPIQSPVKNCDITEENGLVVVRNGCKEDDVAMEPKEELVEMGDQAESTNVLDVLESSSDATIDVVNDDPVKEGEEEIKENKIIPLNTEETVESSSQKDVEMEVENEVSSSLHVSSAQQEEDRVKSLSLSSTEESNGQEVESAPVPLVAQPDPAMEPLHHLTQFLADPAPPLANLSLSDLGVISRTMAKLVEIQSQLVTRLVKDNA